MPTLNDAISANVRAERGRRKWTQKQLGELIGRSDGTVSDIESGQRKVGIDDVAAFCLAFGIGLRQLALGADPDALRAVLGPET